MIVTYGLEGATHRRADDSRVPTPAEALVSTAPTTPLAAAPAACQTQRVAYQWGNQ